jgi:hypothetical protein
MRLPRIVATRVKCDLGGHSITIERVALSAPPVASMTFVDALFGNWWFRAGGYPVGALFGTASPTEP